MWLWLVPANKSTAAQQLDYNLKREMNSSWKRITCFRQALLELVSPGWVGEDVRVGGLCFVPLEGGPRSRLTAHKREWECVAIEIPTVP